MIAPEYAIWKRASTLPAVVAIAGSRVWLMKAPPSPAYPLVLIQPVDDPLLSHMRGPINCSQARIQVDARTKETSGYDARAAVAQLAAAVDGDGLGESASGLSGFLGVIATSPPLEVRGVQRINREYRYDPQELTVLTMTLEYYVWYRQTVWQ